MKGLAAVLVTLLACAPSEPPPSRAARPNAPAPHDATLTPPASADAASDEAHGSEVSWKAPAFVAGAPAFVVHVEDGEIRVVRPTGSEVLVPGPVRAAALDAHRSWLWYAADGLEVLDLLAPKAPAVRIADEGGDFAIAYPNGEYIASNRESVSVELTWSGRAMSARPDKLGGGAQRVNKAWFAANRKRAMRPGATIKKVSKSAAFGRTGLTLIVSDGACVLRDDKGRTLSPLDPERPGADEREDCGLYYQFDRTERWWIARPNYICSKKGCLPLPDGVYPLGWLASGIELTFPDSEP